MDNETGELTKVAPLFDHNQALVADIMEKNVTDTMSQMLNTKNTIREIYERFSSYVSFSIDCRALLELTEKKPEYKKIIERVEERISEVRGIQKIVSVPNAHSLSDMMENIEKQSGITSRLKVQEKEALSLSDMKR